MTSEELRKLTLEHAGDNHHVDPWDAGAGSGFLGGGVSGAGARRGRSGRFVGAEAAAQARSRRVSLNNCCLGRSTLLGPDCSGLSKRIARAPNQNPITPPPRTKKMYS